MRRHVGVLLVVGGLLATGCGPAGAAAKRPSVESFRPLLERAAAAQAPDVRIHTESELVPSFVVGGGGGENHSAAPPGGWSAGTTDRPACAQMILRDADWSRAVELHPHGAPGVAIAVADAQAAVLAEAGFVPIDAGWSAADRGGTRFGWTVVAGTHRSGGMVSAQPTRLVHWRLYHSPGTSAFVTARNAYDGATGAATVEMTCLEAAADSADRMPELRVPVRETLGR